jgi:hypothetical protein
MRCTSALHHFSSTAQRLPANQRVGKTRLSASALRSRCVSQRIWPKDGAGLHDKHGGTAERGDKRQTRPVEHECCPLPTQEYPNRGGLSRSLYSAWACFLILIIISE